MFWVQLQIVWLALMDRLLTCNVPESEQNKIINDMLDLVDIYYFALDAPKKRLFPILHSHILLCSAAILFYCPCSSITWYVVNHPKRINLNLAQVLVSD
uniref:Uncharacterized protein n=1 Tax=Arundo donax TaxID=35708 RepID=A0A0A9C2W7_ARUDO